MSLSYIEQKRMKQARQETEEEVRDAKYHTLTAKSHKFVDSDMALGKHFEDHFVSRDHLLTKINQSFIILKNIPMCNLLLIFIS